MWIGTDGGVIAAVARWEDLDGPGDVFLNALAVGLDHRHQGGEVADELMEVILEEIQARAIEACLGEVIITCHIHRQNLGSQAMCRRAHLRHVDMHEDGELQVWALRILLPDLVCAMPPPFDEGAGYWA